MKFTSILSKCTIGVAQTNYSSLWIPYSEFFQNKAVLSYKAVDRSVFFSDFDKYASIDAARTAMAKPYEVNWPCSREDEVFHSIIKI